MQLTVNGKTVNVNVTSTGKSLMAIDQNGEGSDYILIQTKGPLRKAEKEELERLGVESLEFLASDGFVYLCHFKPDDIAPIQAQSYVIGVSIYHPDFKITSNLQRSVDASGVDSGDKEIKVLLHPQGTLSIDDAAKQVADAAEISPDLVKVDAESKLLTFKIDPTKVSNLASVDAVKVVEEVVPKTLYNDCARRILGFDPPDPQTPPFPFTGAGQVVAVADTGLDKGSFDDMHPAFKGRVKDLISIGRTKTNGVDDPHGHGTHVCGSIAGAPLSTSTFQQVQGTAPAAELVVQSLWSSTGLRIPADKALVAMFLDPYKRHKAYIHSNSWGDGWTGQQIVYSAECALVDQCIVDNPDLLIVMAAGNSGIQLETGTLGSLAACKNVLTVGATESTRASFHGKPLKDKAGENDPTEVSWYSSRGPTAEQRIKPDVLAPGTAILSTLTRLVTKLPRNDLEPSGDDNYAYCTGSSMATPLVAGCAAVLREFLGKTGTPNPPAALMKALLINGAYAFHHAHNGREGFGIVNIANSLIPRDATDGGFRFGEAFDDIDQQHTVTVNIPKIEPPASNANITVRNSDLSTLRVSPPARGGITLKVTLAYTDVPGPALQNNLNLQVISKDGVTRNGNRGSSKYFDNNNNVEQITWKGITPGEATIVVKCSALTSHTQDYALVWRIIPSEE